MSPWPKLKAPTQRFFTNYINLTYFVAEEMALTRYVQRCAIKCVLVVFCSSSCGCLRFNCGSLVLDATTCSLLNLGEDFAFCVSICLWFLTVNSSWLA